jgi:purine operon repressor
LRAGSRISDLKYKLMTVELLNFAKYYYTYRELAGIVGLPETVISRYVKGHVLPTIDRARSINQTLQKIMRLEGEIQQRIKFDELGYFDNTRLISDTLLLERAVQHAIQAFAGKRITKVLVAAVDGIPLATLIAHRLGVRLVIAKKSREVGVHEFIEEVYIPGKTAIMMSLFVPRDAIRKGDCVLIVDDVIDTGETQIALSRIVQKAKAEVSGIYALVSIGNEWKTKIEQTTRAPVEISLRVDKKTLLEISDTRDASLRKPYVESQKAPDVNRLSRLERDFETGLRRDFSMDLEESRRVLRFLDAVVSELYLQPRSGDSLETGKGRMAA